MTSSSVPDKPAEPADEVVGIAAISDHFMVVTKRGKLYRVDKNDQDMVKLWIEIPV